MDGGWLYLLSSKTVLATHTDKMISMKPFLDNIYPCKLKNSFLSVEGTISYISEYYPTFHFSAPWFQTCWLSLPWTCILKLESSNWMNYCNSYRCTLRSETTFGKWKSFKNDEKCFLFHLNMRKIIRKMW